MAKINSKFEETQKTLALIPVKLINPTAIQHDGFGVPPITQTSSPNEVITPTSNFIGQSSIFTPANHTADNSVSHANTSSVSAPANNAANQYCLQSFSTL